MEKYFWKSSTTDVSEHIPLRFSIFTICLGNNLDVFRGKNCELMKIHEKVSLILNITCNKNNFNTEKWNY